MIRIRIAACAALSGLGAILLFFGGPPGIARADIAGPSFPLPDFSSWTARAVAIVCVVAVIAVIVGIVFIRRARARRPKLPPGNDRWQPPGN
jgi:H+/Cl- antiporter ClcA